ncbi:hypothetical protein, partial [Nonomuraea rosea]|uniref:hypothetical protein n=1 Tax=Nonomuraea rosea TaxID=638574 RepID=UPI0031EC0281
SGCIPTKKESIKTAETVSTGLCMVFHALAFNTLLSSQETDAYSLVWIFDPESGAHLPFSTSYQVG